MPSMVVRDQLRLRAMGRGTFHFARAGKRFPPNGCPITRKRGIPLRTGVWRAQLRGVRKTPMHTSIQNEVMVPFSFVSTGSEQVEQEEIKLRPLPEFR